MLTSHPDRSAARAHILKHGWNSTCYQILNPGIEHWWSGDGAALVGFVRYGGIAIVAGAPVCAPEDLAQAVAEWETFAAQEKLGVCYFGAEGRLQSALSGRPGYAQVVLGSQPEWHPAEFARHLQDIPSLRAQLNRATNKGVAVREWGQAEAENHPALVALLHEWLAGKELPTLHFLVEPETLGNLADRRVFVAEMGGAPVGFVTLCPIPAQRGWLTEQFVRGNQAPNGTVELMLAASAQAVAEVGAAYFSMGIVPLVSPVAGGHRGEPGWLRFARRWARAHYTRFYNFRGLSEFKSKFLPQQWQPVVVVVRGERFRYRHLRAIAGAFTQGHPEAALARGLMRAVRTEIRTLQSAASKGRRRVP